MGLRGQRLRALRSVWAPWGLRFQRVCFEACHHCLRDSLSQGTDREQGSGSARNPESPPLSLDTDLTKTLISSQFGVELHELIELLHVIFKCTLQHSILKAILEINQRSDRLGERSDRHSRRCICLFGCHSTRVRHPNNLKTRSPKP